MVLRDCEDETCKGIGELSPAPGSRSPEFTYTAAHTETFLTLDGVSGNVFRGYEVLKWASPIRGLLVPGVELHNERIADLPSLERHTTQFLGGHMRTMRHLIVIVSIFGMFTSAMAGCEAQSDENTEDGTVKTLPPKPEEVVPRYGINFARFPVANSIINEHATLRDNHVPYVRVNFGFDPDVDTDTLLANLAPGMNDTAANGIFILPVIHARPLPEDGNKANEYLAKLTIFTKRLAETYGPNGVHPGMPIRAWEIINEPNYKRFSVGNANAYRRILRAARKGLRSGDPRARIIFGGLSSIINKCELKATESAFLSDVLTPPNRCLVDAVAYHPYANTPELAQKRANDLVDVMRKELHLLGDSSSKDDVQFWITELGWGIGNFTPPGPSVSKEDEQAQSIRSIAHLSNQDRNHWNLGPTLWYVYTDEIAAGESGWAAVAGVYKSKSEDSHIRPAWDVIGNFASQNPWIQLPGVHICPTDETGTPDDESEIKLSTQMDLTLDAQNGAPGAASVSGCVTATDGTVNVIFEKFVDSSWMTTGTPQRTLHDNHYEVLDWGVGVGQWRVHAEFPEQGVHSMSEHGVYSMAKSNYVEFEIKRVPTQTYLTLDGYQNGAPGAASVSGNVRRGDGSAPATGTVNVNFQKLEGTTWTTKSTAQRVLVNGHYEVLNWGAGLGEWRVRAVFPEQGNYDSSESNYHYFSIQRVATNTFLTLGQVVNGHPGHVSTSGHVLRTNGNPASGTVNVNFEKLMNGTYVYMNTAQRILTNGYYEVLNWGVGVGQWRVRAVFPEQGDYSYSESNYHYFSIQ